MKRIVRYIVALGLIAVLSAPVVEARDGRTGRGNNTTTQQNNGSGAPKPTTKPAANPGHRPGGNNNRPASGNKPSTGNRPPQVGNQPSNRPTHGNTPDARPPQVNQPGKRPTGNTSHYRPGNNNPWQGHHTPPPPAPSHNVRPPQHHTPPPPPRHDHWPVYHKPTPPPGYVYRGHGPSFGTILGIALGSAINASLNHLYNNGYQVAGYANNEIYLSNVMQMNYTWPDAVLYYNGGHLSSSRYIYHSDYNTYSRYNSLYNTFINQYGMPGSVNNSGNSMSASWFGYDGRFVTISYAPGYASNGMYGYYTTLTFGN